MNTGPYTVPAGGGSIVINGTTIPLAANASVATVLGDINTALNSSSPTGDNGGPQRQRRPHAHRQRCRHHDRRPGRQSAGLGIGLTTGSTPPVTNLLTQNAVAQNETMIIQFAPNAATTITFGTLANQIASMAALNTALGALPAPGTLNGGSGSINAQGDITLTAGNLTNSISVTGSATTSVFGLKLNSALPPRQDRDRE